jgi:hypothetical protein
MATTPTKLMTFEEFERLPEEESRRYELHHGELVKMAEVIWRHYPTQIRVRDLLKDAAGSSGWVEIEFAFRGLAEYEYRRADVAYATKQRVENVDPKGYFMGAPDLVIEILSPSNTVAEMRERGSSASKTVRPSSGKSISTGAKWRSPRKTATQSPTAWASQFRSSSRPANPWQSTRYSRKHHAISADWGQARKGRLPAPVLRARLLQPPLLGLQNVYGHERAHWMRA